MGIHFVEEISEVVLELGKRYPSNMDIFFILDLISSKNQSVNKEETEQKKGTHIR